MFSRVNKSSKVITQISKRFASSSHTEPSKPIEINLTKIFAIAALAGGVLVYKNKKENPILETKLLKQEATGERVNKRNEAYLQTYKISFIKEFIRDKGGVGQKQYGKLKDKSLLPTALIHPSSTFKREFGAGIKTNEIGPRREHIRLYAPINSNN